MEILAHIRKGYSNFSKGNKKIADYLLHQPDKVINQTAFEIALHSKTSPASVIRFVKNIGYEGLQEFKVQLAMELSSVGVNHEFDPIISSKDSLEVLCNKVELLIKEASTDVFTTLDQKALKKAIEWVQKANNVYLFGIGSSSLVAYDLFHKFNRAGRRSSFAFDSHMGIEMLNYASIDDVVIAVTYSGHTKEVLLACEYAKSKNAHIIIITRNNSERIKNLADEILLVPDNEHLLRVGAISSMYSSMIVGTTLYLGVIKNDVDDEITARMVMTKNWVDPLKEE